MRISRVKTGRLCFFLDEEEQKILQGPVGISLQRGYVVLSRSANGTKGWVPKNQTYRVVDTCDPEIWAHFPIAGPTPVMCIINSDEVSVALTDIRAAIGSIDKPRTFPEPSPKSAAPLALPAPEPRPAVAPSLTEVQLGALVEELNRRRDADGPNLAYSIDPDGYLEVIVSYGRRKG